MMTGNNVSGGPEQAAIHIGIGLNILEGMLSIPQDARGVVLFAHGSGSSRHSPRNNYVASVLQQAGLATLLIDLLIPEEEALDHQTAALRFDIELLAERLIIATDWLRDDPRTNNMSVGYFGSSTGAGAALVAATRRMGVVGAVVSRGGRPDLAGPVLHAVQAPTLLIVGGNDAQVVGLNHRAYEGLHCIKQLEIVSGATHLFQEPGALEQVAALAREWFTRYLNAVEARALGV